MKALICGNAPCLIEETNDKDLSEFFIVRMNGFRFTRELPECHAWSSWPDPSHRAKHARHEPIYDVAEYASLVPELWLVHPFFMKPEQFFKRHPDYVIPVQVHQEFKEELGSNPNMGMLMIKAAQLQLRFSEIYVAGFDHYESPNDYYFMEGKFDHPAHKHEDNKRWFENQLEVGMIKKL